MPGLAGLSLDGDQIAIGSEAIGWQSRFGTAVDRSGRSAAAADRAAGQRRVDPGPPGVDHHGVGVRDAGVGDRPAGRRDEDTVRDVIHAFDERGLAALDPQWAGGRPRLISDDDIAFIIETATTRPAKLAMATNVRRV
jgi:hypothetical protein